MVGRRAAVGAARLSSTADAYLFGLLTEESVLPAEFRELRLSKMAVGFARGAWCGDVTTRGGVDCLSVRRPSNCGFPYSSRMSLTLKLHPREFNKLLIGLCRCRLNCVTPEGLSITNHQLLHPRLFKVLWTQFPPIFIPLVPFEPLLPKINRYFNFSRDTNHSKYIKPISRKKGS